MAWLPHLGHGIRGKRGTKAYGARFDIKIYTFGSITPYMEDNRAKGLVATPEQTEVDLSEYGAIEETQKIGFIGNRDGGPHTFDDYRPMEKLGGREYVDVGHLVDDAPREPAGMD
jgi:hypothetical protein